MWVTDRKYSKISHLSNVATVFLMRREISLYFFLLNLNWGIFLHGIFPDGIFSWWDFVLWDFVLMRFFPLGFFPLGFFPTWDFVLMGFFPRTRLKEGTSRIHIFEGLIKNLLELFFAPKLSRICTICVVRGKFTLSGRTKVEQTCNYDTSINFQ